MAKCMKSASVISWEHWERKPNFSGTPFSGGKHHRTARLTDSDAALRLRKTEIGDLRRTDPGFRSFPRVRTWLVQLRPGQEPPWFSSVQPPWTVDKWRRIMLLNDLNVMSAKLISLTSFLETQSLEMFPFSDWTQKSINSDVTTSPPSLKKGGDSLSG